MSWLALGFSPFAEAIDWQPLDPGDLAATASAIDPDAGAEILYRYLEIDDSFNYDSSGSSSHEYIRIKIYNDKGVRELDKIDIPYTNLSSVRRLMARVIKPGGGILEVNKDAFHQRDIVKKGDRKVQVISFSFPSIEPGDIVEYKWDTRSDTNVYGLQLRLLREMPTRRVCFRVKPFLAPGLNFDVFYHQCQQQKFERDREDFHSIELRDLPAFKEEPWMPPEDEVQPWILFYPMLVEEKPGNFWPNTGKTTAGDMASYTRRPSKEIKEAAARITAGATTVEERARLINDYCRNQILNTSRYIPKSGDIVKPKSKPTPGYTLEKKQGRTIDIVTLYHALARAAGLDSRVALCADRSDAFFRRDIRLSSQLPAQIVAVKDGGGWLFFDPAFDSVPAGSLRWYNEGVPVLVATPQSVEWLTTPLTPADRTRLKRTARLRLNDEGTLMGELRFDYFGHYEIQARIDFMLETPEKREEIMRERLQSRIPGAEISRLEMPGIDDLAAPVYITYNIRIPNYAERVGPRLFFQPGYFEKGNQPRFTAETRDHDIYFPYPWSVEDDVEIGVPAGFSLEEASAPGSMPENADWGKYTVQIAFKKSTKTIIYKRAFAFTPVRFSKESYAQVKRLFSALHHRDAHTLSLKSGAPSGETGAAPAAAAAR
ncbi:DUF3857 and transglutaminase domain-containing protein [Termitidicoccus mucosus]|uniref:DUF3857 domain-containing protein n=1 Tax=Termitidicoccus mucosus TaxID=1184151 RepID=A0A178ICR9_9BACT|nr:hypothetical protein AW736_20565 [Opitutaceae bacterium TSB47]